MNEVADYLVALLRVGNLRVELDTVGKHRFVAHDGAWRVFGESEREESGGHLGYAVTMAHPDRHRGVETFEKRVIHAVETQLRVTVLTLNASDDRPAELMRQRLHSVADAEDWYSSFEDPRRN